MSYHLFEVAGIELEYMVINASDLKIAPIVDQLLTAKNGTLNSDIENGRIEWSNELVAHVIELKTHEPDADLDTLDTDFHKNIVEISELLKPFKASLLPSAAHPFMDSKTEKKLWEHDHNEIYSLYDKIFDCSGHGWANLQSMHINLPFWDDAEFEKLHAAIRVMLPIMPGLSASSPVFDGKNSGFKDARLEYYKYNQKEIPQMAGKVIPEGFFSKADYHTGIFNPIKEAIKPFDPNNILEHYFLNSRGAIARFDRFAIEIRVLDIQECPKADIAIAVLIIEALKWIVSSGEISLETQKKQHEDDLLPILNQVIKDGEEALITDENYLQLFGFKEEASVNEIWSKLYAKVKEKIGQNHQKTIEILLKNGTLSTRILKGIGEDFTHDNILQVYRKLEECLLKNEIYLP
tara:strand:+ start:114500 stop:115720 length:1221 start_codon:yes stop_codon:yes gene_type:complete